MKKRITAIITAAIIAAFAVTATADAHPAERTDETLDITVINEKGETVTDGTVTTLARYLAENIGEVETVTAEPSDWTVKIGARRGFSDRGIVYYLNGGNVVALEVEVQG